MYRDLKVVFWWRNMKNDIAEFVENCLICQQVKAANQRPSRPPKTDKKSYADRRQKELEFAVGDSVFLKVTPMKGVLRFGKREKLRPRYIGSFEILKKVESVAYQLALPPKLSTVHDVFHISTLKKYVPDPSHVLKHQPMKIQQDLSYEDTPLCIIARKVQKLCNKEIPLVKVLWQHHSVDDTTWEREDEMQSKYPQLFDNVN
ncbi:uncharacterized protein LOC111386351 [Olea europaea var. sylvestris]|uniref:uncharacterized protein LOC111386351 n=1 Tax=Olea europaea var. sylvestris TaxID=158386 RepID=UPI000C1D6E6F|nr:uncharacterized protein LOC111386351 [Olea europaea var. sylvestris]